MRLRVAVRGARVAVLALVAACSPRVKPGLEVTVLVQGGDAPGERVRRIELLFDRAMVGEDRLGRVDPRAPFTLSPKVAGQARWREDRKLVFEPEAPLPRSTRFVVTVPRGTVALDGHGLDRAMEHAFETERLTLRTSPRHEPGRPDPRRWAAPDQAVSLHFNQPVTARAIEKHCRFEARGEGGPAPVAVAARPLGEVDGEKLEADQGFLAEPVKALRPGTEWWFRCDAALPGAEGPLGLAPREGAPPEFEEAIGRPPDGLLALRTWGPLQVVRQVPAGTEVDPDAAELTIELSNPIVREAGAPPRVTITPAPRDVGEVHLYHQTLSVPVAGLAPHTDYRVRLEAGLRDVFGQTLVAPFEASFRTGQVQPGFTLETGSWTVEAARGAYVGWARNVPELNVRAAALSPADLFKVLPQIDWWDDEPVDLKALRVPFRERALRRSGDPLRWEQVVLDPAELLGKAAAGTRFYYLAARAPGVQRWGQPQGWLEVLLNVTDLGLNAKLSSNSGLVWVTRLHDGAPLPDAEVIVQGRDGRVRWRGRTDADGLARTPGRAALLGKQTLPGKRPAAEVGEGDEADPAAGEEGEGEDEWGYKAELLVFAKLGDDVTFVDPDRAGGFSGWNFAIPVRQSPRAEGLRGFLHTDRGLYRPGDTVQVRGLARVMRLGEGLRVPEAGRVEVVVRDPRDRIVHRQRLALSRFGSFALSYPVDEAAALGDYQVEGRLPEGKFSATFSVEAYRPASFETTVTSGQGIAYAGETLKANVQSTYFHGAPVRGGDLTCRVHTRPRVVEFDAFPGFAFDDARAAERAPWVQESFLTEEAAKLDAEGKAVLTVPLPASAIPGPVTLLVSASVQDETNQTVSGNLALPLHRTRYYLGLDAGGWLAAAGKPHPVKIVAVNARGQPIAARVKLSVIRRRWDCAWERWGYSGSYRCNRNDETVHQERLELSKDGPREQAIVLPGPGEYFVEAEGQDARNNTVIASQSLYATGDGDSPWRVDDTARFEIVADRRQYRPGDTARLLVKSQLAGASALLTLERDGILEVRRLHDLRDGQTLDVPITAAHAPNVYVSLLLVRGRSGDGARGLPRTTMGMVGLPVVADDKRLQVEVATDKQDYRPGGKVTATVTVRDGAGQPVQAEIALAAADEGVLSLIGFRTPDPLGTFYAPWELGVVTASQYARLAQVPAPGEERYATGGDGSGRPGTLRARMRSTAYWNPALQTDAQGRARVTFEAPDNLTAFRVMAVAADAGDRFGSGDRRFRVNKPLQILSALPRFALVGDRFAAAALVSNETGAAGTAEVSLEILPGAGAAAAARPGVAIDGERTRRIELGKGARGRVGFPVSVLEPGPVRVRFTARLGDETDGLEVVLPVAHPGPVETELLSQGHTDGSTQVAVRLPAGVLPGTAELDVSVDPDGLAGIEDSLRDLIQYPYGCLEQTTSRLIPLVAVSELARGLGLSDLDGEGLQRFVRVAIGKIYGFQSLDGGFGLWPGQPAETYLTAYALWGLELARRAGYAVDRARMDDAVAYLRRALQEPPRTHDHYTMGGELGDRAFVLYVLGLTGKPEADHAVALADRLAELPRYGVALLARALAAVTARDHPRVLSLIETLRAGITGDAQAATVPEPRAADLRWYFSSDARTTAIVTDALLELAPAHPDLPRLVRGLLKARRRGTWYTTQENLFALVALANHVKAGAERAAPQVTIARGDGAPLLTATLQGKGAERLRRVRVAIDPADVRPLRIVAQGGTVHYQARARFRRAPDARSALSEGFGVRREFVDADSGAPLAQVQAGKLVRIRLWIDAPAERNRVALEDWLPAGFEAVNTRFATVAAARPADDPSWRERLWTSHVELHDDRTQVFADWVYQGRQRFDYLARATTEGTFVVPAATVEAMYDPDLRARTATTTFTVLPR